jgi:mono/diheme cytochrome c family protein
VASEPKVWHITRLFQVLLMLRPSILLASLVLAAPLARAQDARELWTNGVQALLDQNCVKCHGPLKQKSGLALDTLEGVLKGNEDGAIVDAKKPDESKLLEALTAKSDPHMPPKKQLNPHDIAEIRAWITALASLKPEAKPAPIPDPPASTEPSAAIDYFLTAHWKARNLTPAPLCDDLTFVRRIFLDLAGRIPKPDEVSAFLADSAPAKREALVDRLLAGDEYPVAFREIWDALLMGRYSGRREGRRRNDGWFKFLESSFKKNRPWNEVVRAMIVARQEKPEDIGSACFLFERKNDFQQMAEAVAPVIYGTRVDCAQCHDHPLAREIKQAHYWGLVAVFNRSKNVEKREPNVAESAVGGFMNFTNLKKESQPAIITMLTGRTIDEVRPGPDEKQEDRPDGYLDPNAPVKTPKYSRRAAFAQVATTDNPLLARAFINYTWAILMGRGIVHPVDEMNSRNPPSHPELLNWLAEDFASHNFDMRRVIRSIVLSRAYQLAPAPKDHAPPQEAFAACMEKPLIAETLLRSTLIATGRPASDPALRQAFADSFPDVLPRTIRATIQQAMFVTNSDQFSNLFHADPGAASEQIAALKTPEEQVREAFRRSLIREPDADELAHGVEFLRARAGHPAEAVGQLLWALVTGPEFLMNH